jgi:hypothetical protein
MENFGISFKFQMTNYVYMEDENDESFFNLLIPNIYDVSEENELEVLRAINNVNNSMKVAKLVISNDSVWVCFENLLDKEHKMEDLVPVAVSTLYQARQRFYAALKEE